MKEDGSEGEEKGGKKIKGKESIGEVDIEGGAKFELEVLVQE